MSGLRTTYALTDIQLHVYKTKDISCLLMQLESGTWTLSSKRGPLILAVKGLAGWTELNLPLYWLSGEEPS